MKKHITKLKHWIIKRLGGYIDVPHQIYKELVIQSVERKPITINANVSIPYNVALNKEEVSRRIVNLIADEIYKRELYNAIHVCDDGLNRVKNYRLEFDVLPPK